MKCHSLLFGKIKKNISKLGLLKILSSMLFVMGKGAMTMTSLKLMS